MANSSKQMALASLCVLSFALGDWRPRGSHSAAEGGDRTVRDQRPPQGSETTPTTGTDSTGRPMSSSGGVTGAAGSPDAPAGHQ